MLKESVADFGQVGLGLRREMLDEMLIDVPKPIEFLEVAPENWLKLGGRFGKQFKQLPNNMPLYAMVYRYRLAHQQRLILTLCNR